MIDIVGYPNKLDSGQGEWLGTAGPPWARATLSAKPDSDNSIAAPYGLSG